MGSSGINAGTFFFFFFFFFLKIKACFNDLAHVRYIRLCLVWHMISQMSEMVCVAKVWRSQMCRPCSHEGSLVLGDEGADPLLAGPLQLVHHLAVLEGLERGHATDLACLRSLGVSVHIHLHEDGVGGQLLSHGGEHRGDALAGWAP